MTAGKINVSDLMGGSVTWTLFGTLYLRAWDSRAEHPILNDHYAAEALDRIDYDFASLKRRLRPSSNQFLVALRAKQFDNWAAGFLARHPDATVLHLGCGLDSRMLRLAPPATVRWYDVDIPEVIELRRRLYPEHDGYRMIGASVTDPDWLREVPADRPVLVVAEGLFPYLAEGEIRELLRRLADRFGSGELAFDAAAPWLARLVRPHRWGLRDGHEIERWEPRLRCVEHVPFTTHYAWIPVRGYRLLYRVGHAIPGWRGMFSSYRFTFPPAEPGRGSRPPR